MVYSATPNSTAVVEGSSISDVLLLTKAELMMVTEVEDRRVDPEKVSHSVALKCSYLRA